MFAIYDARKQPIKICSSSEHIPKFENAINTLNEQFARGLISLYNTSSDLFNYKNENSLDFIYPVITINLAGDFLGFKTIKINNNSMQIIIPSIFFNIPFGVYSYDVKLVSDLEDVLHPFNAVSESNYKNSTTWMEGKFTVNKN